jgi:outer membrane protein assembly factor BamB
MLIAGSNWKALYGHDLKTGKKKWLATSDGIRFRSAAPVYIDDTLFVVAESAIIKMNPRDGSIYKSLPVKYNLQVASTPLITGNMVIMGTAADGLVAFDRFTMNELWKVKTGPSLIYTSPYSKPPSSTVESSPVRIENNICFGASDGFLYLVNLKDGQVTQRIDLGAPVLGKVCYTNNAVFVADFSGNISCFELK